jgi:ABC-type amino acid transport substrate-binding protein
MTKASKTILAIVAVIVIAIAGGYFGSSLRGSSAEASGTAPGAFIDGIKERGELRVGIAVAPPMTADQPDGTRGGPNVIPLQNLAEELGVEFTPVAAEWSNIVAGLQAGRYDFAAYLDSTLERSLSIQFTNSVYDYQGVFVVKADSPYNDTDSLIAGGQIAAAQGTSYESTLVELGADVFSIDSIPNALSSLNSGRVVGLFVDLPTAIGQAQADPTLKIVVPDPVVFQTESGYGVPEDIDPRSLQVVNIAIKTAQDSGELSRAFAEVGYVEIDQLGDLQKK